MAYAPVGISAGTSSFYVDPAPVLDPSLFDGTRLRANIRQQLVSSVVGFLGQRYAGASIWLRAWLAGSAVSYRWHASSGLKDLDVLLGVDFIAFRLANRDFSSMGNKEIAKHMNDEMRAGLWQSPWNHEFEATFYVNPESSEDIRTIKPYAAYNLIEDAWDVPPSPEAPQVPRDFDLYVGAYHERAQQIVERYSAALVAIRNSVMPAARVNAEARVQPGRGPGSGPLRGDPHAASSRLRGWRGLRRLGQLPVADRQAARLAPGSPDHQGVRRPRAGLGGGADLRRGTAHR